MDNNNKNVKQLTPIAIIGAGCLFPKSEGLKAYWRLLYHGIDGITEVPDTHWSPDDYFNQDPKIPDHTYCKRGGFLSPISFDPSEFGIPPNSIEATDTSQILGLVASKMALDNSGYGENGKSFDRDRTSVILGVTGTQELVIPLGARMGFPKWRKALQESGVSPDKIEESINRISSSYVGWKENSFPGLLGNVVAGRICNRLDLGGTNCVVDAACASSMSAIYLALMELSSGRSDMVITGGVDTLNDIFMHMCFSKTQALSFSGDARPFSKDADGTVLGEGVGLLVLKRLEEAEQDNDHIYAVIKSIGTSSDGKSQSIYSPRIEGQVKSLQRAYEYSEIEPSTVKLIEAHGTGTRVGDSIEFKALDKFLNDSSVKPGSCALGSVKSNIGHTKSAAGAAGLIKSALSLHHKVFLPTLKAQNPDPNLEIDKTPLYLNTDSRPWFPSKNHPRRCGVSAFGFGGSNFHVVLEEHTSTKCDIAWDGSVQIFALSAPSKQELIEKMLENKHVVDNGKSWRDVSVLSEKTRKDYHTTDAHRILLVLEPKLDEKQYLSEDLPDLFLKATEMLETNSTDTSWTLPNVYYGSSQDQGKIAFLFPGQGSQYINMGKDVLCTFPEAFNSVSLMCDAFKGDRKLNDIIYPIPSEVKNNPAQCEQILRQTDIAQPAIGAMSMAMFKTLQRFQVTPDAVCGHSFGELTALFAAGWIDEQTYCDLSVARGHVMANTGKDKPEQGSMIAVRGPLNKIENLVENSDLDIVLANRNSPDQGVISGPSDSVFKFEDMCKKNGYSVVRLPVSAAFHTSMVKDAVEPFLNYLNHADVSPTNTPVFSNTTGEPYSHDPSTIVKCLAEQILHPVDFVQNIQNMFKSGVKTFIEVGPKSVLTNMVKSILDGHTIHAISMDPSAGKNFGISDLAHTLCYIASLGHTVELNHWEHPLPEQRKQMMSLPISGANYRAESKPGINQTPSNTNKTISSNTIDTSMNKNATYDPEIITNALKTVQDALNTMQSLQIQTTQTHNNFLKAQEENSRILKALIDNTRQITEGTLGIKLDRPPTPSDTRLNVPLVPNVSETSVLPEETTKPLQGEETEPPLPTPVNDTLKQTMLDVVSQLTGYPVEMLDMDMDIEADLGIDSIKKVEILSTLEETIDHLPQISPEIIGSLKTLGQIAEYLSNDSQTEQSRQELPSNEPPVQKNSIETPGIKNATNKCTNDIKTILLDVVCQLTGYPEEMLSMDMDIEADLGIDSIKKVEILSTLEESIPDLPQVSPDHISSLKTLGQILEYLSSNNAIENTNQSSKKDIEFKPEDTAVTINNTNMPLSELSRKIISVVREPLQRRNLITLSKGKKIFVTDDKSGLSRSIVDELIDIEIDAVHISINNKNMNSLAESASGLIIVQNPDSFLSETDCRNIFLTAKTFAPYLMENGKTNSAVFSTISRMDGAFGFSAQTISNPEHGALAGLVKTASIEWENVMCRAIDVHRDTTPNNTIAKNIVYEILNEDHSSPVEIGVSTDSRAVLNLETSPVPTGDIRLGKDDVIIVTGGARGVTASCIHTLAKHTQPTLILFGRSPLSDDEPEWLKDLDHPAVIKKAILDNEFNGKNATPVQIESSYQTYMATREIKENINKFQDAGSAVKYYPIDILNKNSLIHAVDEIKSLFGPISGIIHGAGVLHDRLIIEKTADQFESVFNTKVTGLKNLLEATSQDKLKHLVIFSSIAARTGNRGQSDYAMANEVLNKLAAQLSHKHESCSVVSINWGPWDGGMVSSALKKEFQRNNVELIPVEKGAKALLDEMRGYNSSHVEVIIAASDIVKSAKKKTDPSSMSVDKPPVKENLSLTFKREIDVKNYPILNSHVLDGTPVVPLALISEWMGHGALHDNPGLILHGLDNMRVLKGIRLDQDKKLIRLLAGKARKNGAFYEVDIELRDGLKGDADIIHSKAKAILTDTVLEPPEISFNHHNDLKPFPMSMDEIYDKVLFHGADLRGIKKIKTYSSQGIIAEVSSAPSPVNWMTEPLRNKWIGDPLALDCAFQMATLWCYAEKGVVSLPSYNESYRQYRTNFPDGTITAILDVTDATEHKMKGNFTFLDQEGSVIARLEGYEAVMDASLFKSFKPQYATA